MSELTNDRVAREVEHLRKFAQSDKGSSSYCLIHSGAIIAHIDAQAEEIERLRRERAKTRNLVAENAHLRRILERVDTLCRESADSGMTARQLGSEIVGMIDEALAQLPGGGA